MQHSSHSPVNSRPSSLSHHPLPSSYHSNHYGSVKVEDDHYSVSFYAINLASALLTPFPSHQTIITIMAPPTITTPHSLHLPKLYQKLKSITGMLIRPNEPRFNIGRTENQSFLLLGLNDTPALLLSLSRCISTSSHRYFLESTPLLLFLILTLRHCKKLSRILVDICA